MMILELVFPAELCLKVFLQCLVLCRSALLHDKKISGEPSSGHSVTSNPSFMGRAPRCILQALKEHVSHLNDANGSSKELFDISLARRRRLEPLWHLGIAWLYQGWRDVIGACHMFPDLCFWSPRCFPQAYRFVQSVGSELKHVP